MVGMAFLTNIQPECRTANLGYWARTKLTGCNVAMHGALATIAFAFEVLKLNRIEIVTRIDSLVSGCAAHVARNL